jgi:hypothetical protein
LLNHIVGRDNREDAEDYPQVEVGGMVVARLSIFF